MSKPGGDCLSCGRLSGCPDTSPEKVLASFVCPRFVGASEMVYRARLEAMRRFGEQTALSTMILMEERITTTEEGPEDE